MRHLGWAVAALPLALAACSSGPAGSGGTAGQSPDATLQNAGRSAQSALHGYLAKVAGCKGASSPVTCLEAADRTLGGQIHDYANVLATGRGFTAPAAELAAARNAAQTLANSLEILGDAEPTMSNYDQVQNTFNVDTAITQLQNAIAKVGGGGR
jgi:hypothetical protein